MKVVNMLYIIGKIDNGWQLKTFVLSPPLYIGLIFTHLMSSEETPLATDKLRTCVGGNRKACYINLTINSLHVAYKKAPMVYH